MSQWIRSDYSFDEPCATLVIPRRRTEEITGFLRQHEPREPEQLCKWLTELIEYIRPDLKGVVLYAMDYDMRSQCYCVAAIHQNLPKRKMGDMLEEIRL